MPRKSSLRKQNNDLLDEHALIIASAFLEGIGILRSQVILKRVVEKLAAWDIEGAIAALNIDRSVFGKLEDKIAEAYKAGGLAMANNLPMMQNSEGNRVIGRFDARVPRARNWLDNHGPVVVDRIVEDQKENARISFNDGLSESTDSYLIVLGFVGRRLTASQARTGGAFGLTIRQSEAVSLAYDELLSGEPTLLRRYLNRGRRDKRYDRVVVRAIADQKPLSENVATMIVSGYADSLLALRSEAIGDTEALAGTRAGQNEGFIQGLEKTNYPGSMVSKTWITAGDARVRETHALMAGQEVMGMDTPFIAPEGNQLLYPGDTSLGAGPAEVINCRCWVSYGVGNG